MTEPTHDQDIDRADEDRDISDVGLPQPGDAEPVDTDADEAALDEVFPPAEGSGT